MDKQVVSFSTEPTSDYQAMVRAGWLDVGSAENAFPWQNHRNMERPEALGLAEQEKAEAMRCQWLGSIGRRASKMVARREVLRRRGLDC